MLLMPNKDVWTFNAYEDRVDLEESVYLAGPDGPRRDGADRDLRPRPQGDARAMELRASRRAGDARRAARRTSRNCRCEDGRLPRSGIGCGT